MKLKDLFIGKIVQVTGEYQKSCCVNVYIPAIGYVVDLVLEYDSTITAGSSLDSGLRVLPVVKFVGESVPRKISPDNLEEVK